MKGVSYITDDTNKKTAVVIDFKVLEKYEQQIEDLLYGIIASSRRDEKTITWEKVKEKLKNKVSYNMFINIMFLKTILWLF